MLGIRKIDFSIPLIFGICVKFLDLSFFDLLKKFKTILLVFLLLSSIIPLLLALNAFRANFFNNLVVFNIKISNIAILLKL